MSVLKEIYHPNAYLTRIRNVWLGLRARTRILNILEKRFVDARSIANEVEMRYRAVIHHLKLLEREGVVERKDGKPQVWKLTGVGQKRLVDSA